MDAIEAEHNKSARLMDAIEAENKKSAEGTSQDSWQPPVSLRTADGYSDAPRSLPGDSAKADAPSSASTSTSNSNSRSPDARAQAPVLVDFTVCTHEGDEEPRDSIVIDYTQSVEDAGVVKLERLQQPKLFGGLFGF
mmetsp:Transcript_17827/g.43326  ORF Transcript_17827/g.43326 Transcript_17827/m.43326 type:complete len:137 (-) Transcript_17827:75-485(-)